MISNYILIYVFFFFGLLQKSVLTFRNENNIYHMIQILDNYTNLPVPLVKLSSNFVDFYTDSSGMVAFYVPGMMDVEVWFFIESEGYVFPPDGFGYHGKTINTTTGGETILKINRTMPSERLYRASGIGIYSEQYKITGKCPLSLRNQNVAGQDSINTVSYKGKYFCFWGDTGQLRYPLGNFQATGATVPLDHDIEKPPPLKYFALGDFVKPIAPIEPLNRPTWIGNMAVLEDQLFTTYMKPITVYYGDMGYAKWNDAKEMFEKIRLINKTVEFAYPTYGVGNSYEHEGYLYHMNPFPNVRIPAKAHCYANLSCFESYSPLKEGTSSHPEDLAKVQFDYDEHGNVVYGWKKNTGVLSAEEMFRLVHDYGKLKLKDALYLHIYDVITGKPIVVGRYGGSLSFNKYVNKFVFLFMQINATESNMGEIWLSVSDSLTGPYKYAQKILTHDHHDFYNPKEHYLYANGKYIYFEGTYSSTFDKGPPVPLYTYNNVMYRLNLDYIHLPSRIEESAIETGEEFYAFRRPFQDHNVPVCFNRGKFETFCETGSDFFCSKRKTDVAMYKLANDCFVFP